jgi:polyisoprenoid-binding protein YceI
MHPHAADRRNISQSVAGAGTWHVDATRSRVEFAVRHIMVATVTGRFTEFDGTLEVSDAGLATAIGTIRAATIDTNEPKRDANLRSPDFFDVEHYPTISFASTRIQHLEGHRFRIVGRLTIRRVTREIELEAVVCGAARAASGDKGTTLELRGEISHRDFGLGSRALEASRVLLGDKVKVVAEISTVKGAAARAAA